MKKILAAAILLTFFTGSALAADEFGPRFANQTPGALADAENELLAEGEQTLQDIEPAAGEEETSAGLSQNPEMYGPPENQPENEAAVEK